MIFYFGSFGLVAPGQFTWAWTIIALSFLPIIAACLVAAQLLLDGVSRHLVGAFVGLLAAGLLLPTVDQGWLQDLSNASETPLSETTTATHTSC